MYIYVCQSQCVGLKSLIIYTLLTTITQILTLTLFAQIKMLRASELNLECWKEFDNPNGRGSTTVFPLTNNIWRRLIYDHFKRENLASVIPITNIVWFLWKYILIGADTANMEIRKRARLINTKSNFKNDRFVSFYNCCVSVQNFRTWKLDQFH